MKGPLMEHYQAQSDTANYWSYCVLFKDRLKPAIHIKQWGIIFFKKCCCFMTMLIPIWHWQLMKQQLSWSLRCYHILPTALSASLWLSCLQTFERCCARSSLWKWWTATGISVSRLQEWPKTFFSTGIRKLVEGYKLCWKTQGLYWEIMLLLTASLLPLIIYGNSDLTFFVLPCILSIITS